MPVTMPDPVVVGLGIVCVLAILKSVSNARRIKHLEDEVAKTKADLQAAKDEFITNVIAERDEVKAAIDAQTKTIADLEAAIDAGNDFETEWQAFKDASEVVKGIYDKPTSPAPPVEEPPADGGTTPPDTL